METTKLQLNDIELLNEIVEKIETKENRTDFEDKLLESAKFKLNYLKSNKIVEK